MVENKTLQINIIFKKYLEKKKHFKFSIKPFYSRKYFLKNILKKTIF